MTVEKLKAFLAIILVRGYAGLPRQEMYWERREDCHNLMMTKTKFPECKRYLHQAGNNALNSLDKFTEVRVLFNAINARCILNDHPIQHVSVNESMVACFGNKLWVMATPLGYRI